MQNKVARLRQLMSEAIPQNVGPVLAFPSNCAGITETTQLEQSPRARKIRRVLRLVETYQWPQVLELALDQAGAPMLSALPDDALDSLHEHLVALEDCMQVCGDSPYSPPAR